jgi:hypothetical protein
MIGYSFKIAILSILILVLVHYMFQCFNAIFTQPKIKDYVNISEKHYEKIRELLASQKNQKKEEEPINPVNPVTPVNPVNIININTSIQPTEEDELFEYMNNIF